MHSLYRATPPSPLLFLSLPFSRSRIERRGWDIPGLTTSFAAAMICGAIRHWLQRCVCGRGSGRDGDRALQKVTIRQTYRDRERAPSRDFYWEKRTPEKTLHHRRNASFDQGGLGAPWPRRLRCFYGFELSLPFSTSPTAFMFLKPSRNLSPFLMEGPVRICQQKNAFCC